MFIQSWDFPFTISKTGTFISSLNISNALREKGSKPIMSKANFNYMILKLFDPLFQSSALLSWWQIQVQRNLFLQVRSAMFILHFIEFSVEGHGA